MKVPLLAACTALLSALTLHAGPPALTADRAAKIAQEQLTSRGLAAKHHISSLVLEKATFTSKAVHWVATFTPSIPLGDRRELGVEIGMDGSIVRLVDKAAKAKE